MLVLTRRVSLTAGLALLSMTPTTAASETLASRIAQQYLQTVATVFSLDENRQLLALGSGFFIDSNGHLVTNAHVIEGAASVVVRWRSQRRDAVRVSRFDGRYDAAVIDTGYNATPWAPVGDLAGVAVGEEVVVLGNPRGLEGSVSTGIVSAQREIVGVRYIQITAPISPGSSGGPVFSVNGRVIGIATSTVSRGQNLNFALAAEVLRTLPAVDLRFQSVKAPSQEASDTSRWRDLVHATNVFERIGHEGWLESVTFSIQNDTRVVLTDVVVLLVVRDAVGRVLDSTPKSFPDVIPSGLAKQVRLDTSVKGYAEPFEKYLREHSMPEPRQNEGEDYSKYLQRWEMYTRQLRELSERYAESARRGSIEVRILDFRALGGSSSVDELLRQH